MFKNWSLLSQKACFRYGKVYWIWHWIIAIAEASREIVIKYDYLQFRAIRLWVWPRKVYICPYQSEFRRRFPKHSWFHALILPGSFQKRVNNQFKSYESSLLHIFYFQIDIVNKQLFSSVSWHNPLSKIKFHSLIPLRRTRLLLIFYETFIYKMSVR